MLISHKNRFIYLKTKKTAGTSIEVFFEKYCLDASSYKTDIHHRDQNVSEHGIIGYRGPNSTGKKWYNHMTASEVKSKIGTEIFHEYLKFCAIRNPFDKVVSLFWFILPDEKRNRLKETDFSEIRSEFNSWIKETNELGCDQDIYTIDGKVIVDHFIRFENIVADTLLICNKLGLDEVQIDLPKLKSEYRTTNTHYSEYYDQLSIYKVSKAYSFELEKFGYSI